MFNTLEQLYNFYDYNLDDMNQYIINTCNLIKYNYI